LEIGGYHEPHVDELDTGSDVGILVVDAYDLEHAAIANQLTEAFEDFEECTVAS
jgi:hypothetical protein